MTAKLFSVTLARMNEALGLKSTDIATLDEALKNNGYLRLDSGFNPGNNVRYIKVPETWNKNMLIEAMPQIALARASITISSASGNLDKITAQKITERYSTENKAAKELIALQIAFSMENPNKDYAQPLRETYNFSDASLKNVALWTLSINSKITNQMIRVAADITTVSVEEILASFPEGLHISDDLSGDVIEIQNKGLNPTAAELCQWLKINPYVENPRYEKYCSNLGLNPQRAWQEIDGWLTSLNRT
jgi:hypothetical protein